tara:strand:+ start:189 stop:467 length:279 start_codon:yes stop_codon:yes gene_type:complete
MMDKWITKLDLYPDTFTDALEKMVTTDEKNHHLFTTVFSDEYVWEVLCSGSFAEEREEVQATGSETFAVEGYRDDTGAANSNSKAQGKCPHG